MLTALPTPPDMRVRIRRFFLVLHRSILRVVIGSDRSLLRSLLTPASPESVFTDPFHAFRQALLAGASTTRKSSMQVSPDKSMNLLCASSPFTKSIHRVRLCSVWPTRPLTRPSRTFLYVTSQIWWECDRRRRSGRYLRTHSQASSPRSVALAQLPSPSACSLEAVIWYTDLLEIPYYTQGTGPNWTAPHKFMPMTGVPKR